ASDRTTPSADILDDQGMFENCPHILGHDARHYIARTSSGKRHHDGDRSCRIIVHWPRRRRDTNADGCDAEEANERHYEELSAPHRTNPPSITRCRITFKVCFPVISVFWPNCWVSRP